MGRITVLLLYYWRFSFFLHAPRPLVLLLFFSRTCRFYGNLRSIHQRLQELRVFFFLVFCHSVYGCLCFLTSVTVYVSFSQLLCPPKKKSTTCFFFFLFLFSVFIVFFFFPIRSFVQITDILLCIFVLSFQVSLRCCFLFFSSPSSLIVVSFFCVCAFFPPFFVSCTASASESVDLCM